MLRSYAARYGLDVALGATPQEVLTYGMAVDPVGWAEHHEAIERP